MGRDETLAFIEACEKAAIRPIIDESFVDFANAGDRFTLFDESFLKEHPLVVVIKSLSKGYGIPGLRLGVVASGDLSLISRIRRDVGIWNINSLGEYFLQIFDKYKKDYELACEKTIEERARITREFELLPGLRIYPSQGNYFLCKLDEDIQVNEFCEYLFENDFILVKNLNGKAGISSGEFVRIAIRKREDNDRLLGGIALFLQDHKVRKLEAPAMRSCLRCARLSWRPMMITETWKEIWERRSFQASGVTDVNLLESLIKADGFDTGMGDYSA